MHRLALGVAALLLASSPAIAAGPQVTDPAGDANGTGVVTPAGSLPEYDLTGIRWWADGAAQRVTLTFADEPGEGKFVVSWATPDCATNRLVWIAGYETSYLEGCKPRHRRWPAAPVRSGRTLTFSIPRSALPTWLAPGTPLDELTATAAPLVEAHRVQTSPEADTAYADVRYVVGS